MGGHRWAAGMVAVLSALGSGCEDPSGGGAGAGTEPDEPRTVPVVAALPDFSLTAQDGAPFGSADLKGKVWLADFIFTRCAGTCPLQTQAKAGLQQLLRDHPRADEIQLVTFTVDPEHDQPAVLAQYAERAGADPERWTFLTGSRGDLWNLSANGFRMEVAEDARNTTMPILHSSDFALVDRAGRLRASYDGLDRAGREDLLADLERVLAEDDPASAEPAASAREFKKYPYPAEIIDPPWLADRRDLQLASTGRIEAFHDFRFTDVVESSGITFRNRIVDDAGKYHKAVHYDHGNGLAVADVDGDGLQDLYFTTQLGSNELWRNLGDGTFRNITTPVIALADKIGVAASFGDTDNDGDPDLFVTTVRGGNRFFENDGTGVFTDRTAESGLGYVGHSSAGVFFDYDRDGLLDLFLCNVGVYTTDERGKGGYCIGLPDAFEGHTRSERSERSILYRNTGENRFSDVSQEAGLVDESWSGDAAPFDYDADGWVDLYVLSMQGHDQLYRNVEGKRFEVVGREVFPKTPWGAMGVQVLDYDRDGRQDLFITDMHSDMSEEVGPNREKLKSNMRWEESMLRSGGRSIFGNAFFRGLGEGRFEEASDRLGAENYWPWGPSAGDLNADGFPDLFIASSMNFPFRYGVNTVLLNDRGEHFEDAEFLLGVEPRRGGRTAKPWFRVDPAGEDRDLDLVKKLGLTEPVEIWGALGTRSAALLDLENDGDLDIVTNEFHDGPMVLRSDLAERAEVRWLAVRLVGRGTGGSNRDGLGALVSVTAAGETITQVHDGLSGYLSHSVQPLYFGLGEAAGIEQVTVRWPGGDEQVVREVPLNAVLEVREE